MNRFFPVFTILAAAAAALATTSCKDDGTDESATYTVTVTSGDNGSAVADKERAAEGATITLTATPDNGYEFVRWTVESGGAILSPDATSNEVVFTMPAENVAIRAKFIDGVRINGVIWAYTNVDAPGTFAAKPEDAGMYYQWNRRIGWSTTDPMVDSNGGTTWDSSNATGDEWEAANDPCPEGWRVPTREEFTALCDEEKTTSVWEEKDDVDGRWFIDNENSIFVPAAGYRNSSNGKLLYPGYSGYYWSASPYSGSNGYLLNLDNNRVKHSINSTRSNGNSVRCVAE